MVRLLRRARQQPNGRSARGPAPVARRPATKADSTATFSFSIEMNGEVAATFKDIEGLTYEKALTDTPIVLRQGVVGRALGQWIQTWLQGAERMPERITFSILFQDENGQPVTKWNVRDAFPVAVKPAQGDSEGSDMAIESLSLAHGGVTLDSS